jgi:hypothetical protein
MSIFVIVLGCAVLAWALYSGEIGIYGGGVRREASPLLFWAAFAFCALIVTLFVYLELFVPGF